MPSIFTKIINEEIPCHKILEDETYLSFLDVRPVAPGHTLVIPKKEIDYIFDLDEELLSGIMPFAKKVAAALRKTVECKRIGIMVAGLEVPHAHVHLIPMRQIPDLNFANAKPAENDDLATLAKQIQKNLN